MSLCAGFAALATWIDGTVVTVVATECAACADEPVDASDLAALESGLRRSSAEEELEDE
mgnify:CR=1 FL=1